MKRCSFCNLKNPLYVDYHDNEWCVPQYDDRYLFEMLVLESFQAGLSWECVLNKREDFRLAYNNFDIYKVCEYEDEKVEQLLNNEKIIRNKAKIVASINNAEKFCNILGECGSFYNYLKKFCGSEVIYEVFKTENEISLKIAVDLKKRGMKFLGSTIIYSYLQAIGIINSHEPGCFLHLDKKSN